MFQTSYSRNTGFFLTAEKMGVILLFFAACWSVIVFLLVDPLILNFEKSLLGPFPYVILILISLFIGLAFRRQDLIIVLALVFFEIIVGISEYVAGIHSFFSVEFKGQTQIGDTELLYYNRVFGLSLNSSVYAFKVLIGFVILMAIKSELSKKTFILCSIVMVIGFLTSFNRTAIIAAMISLFFSYRTNWKFLLTLIVISCVISVFYLSSFVNNFTRGKTGLDLSGRDFIFDAFFAIFKQNPLFGNAARKVWLQIDNGLYHAHNSYIEFIVSNGIFISLLFFSGYYLLILRGQLLIALPLLIYSVFQYGLLWGLVFNDIVFFGLMFYLRGNCKIH